MRLINGAILAFLAFVLVNESHAEKGKKSKFKIDLDPNDKLRIGVLHRPETCSRKSRDGDELSMHYHGTLYKDGEKFDSSYDRDTPFDFTLGKGMVIKGWDQGLVGMCIGEKRRLTIPGNLAYGPGGSPPKIHKDATLRFDVELLDIKNR